MQSRKPEEFVVVLAIETATTVCAAAVVREGTILSESSVSGKYIHAEQLLLQVDTVLREAQCDLAAVDGIAVSIGPGSFTGLRIGLSVAKGLAYAADKRMTSVPTLFALAWRAFDGRLARKGEYVLAALDARRDEVYGQLFRIGEDRLEPLTDPRDMLVQDVVDKLPAEKTWITGDARGKLQSELAGRDRPWEYVPDHLALCSAGSVGVVGEVFMRNGEEAVASTLEPLYIKEFYFRVPS